MTDQAGDEAKTQERPAKKTEGGKDASRRRNRTDVRRAKRRKRTHGRRRTRRSCKLPVPCVRKKDTSYERHPMQKHEMPRVRDADDKRMTDFNTQDIKRAQKTLELGKKASIEDVRRAYRKLAKIHHPDASGDPKKFVEIRDCYRTLIKYLENYRHPLDADDVARQNAFEDIYKNDWLWGSAKADQDKRPWTSERSF